MQLGTPLTRLLTLCAFSLAVSACGTKERIQPLFPPAADLKVDPKPVARPEIVTSAQAAAEYDIALESWGERGWRTVGRICRWAKANGMTIDCPGP
jgi:hypothetical protein